MNHDRLPARETVEKTMSALKERGHLPEFVETGARALGRIKELIPAGASVMNGASRTLEEIGFVQYLQEGNHGWNNLHAVILAEKDPARKDALRKQSVISDYYLGSVHAAAETGELLIASNTGSQLPHIVFTSPNLIFVVGVQKIVPGLMDTFDRLQKVVIPLEEKRMQKAYGMGTYPSKIVIVNREQAFVGRKSRVIFVNQRLGF